jgi:hypothetical protein
VAVAVAVAVVAAGGGGGGVVVLWRRSRQHSQLRMPTDNMDLALPQSRKSCLAVNAMTTIRTTT